MPLPEGFLLVMQYAVQQPKTKIPDLPSQLGRCGLYRRNVAHYFAVLARVAVRSGGIGLCGLLHIGILFTQLHNTACGGGLLVSALFAYVRGGFYFLYTF